MGQKITLTLVKDQKLTENQRKDEKATELFGKSYDGCSSVEKAEVRYALDQEDQET